MKAILCYNRLTDNILDFGMFSISDFQKSKSFKNRREF